MPGEFGQIHNLCRRARRAIESVHNGNEAAAIFAARTAWEMNRMDRVILRTDSPAG